jgi:hypothetical protein
MNTEPLAGYGGYTPDELHTTIRRAHEERAKAFRQMFASLFAWRHQAAPRGDVANAPLRTAACM